MSRRALKLVPPTAPRRAPRQDRARVTCDAILIAAERVLERDGVAHLTTNRVAEVAGVSIGSVYQYYPNKQALVAALIERNNGEMITLVRDQLALHPASPPEVAVVAIGFGIRAAFHRQAKVHLALWEHMATLGLTRAFEDSLDLLTDALATWIAGNPTIDCHDPRTTAWVIVRSVEGVMRAQSIGLHAIDEDAVIRETASMLLRHLRRA
ncbi:MAG TPA: TetR/AcrR family transcriptional regulator [Kofleriaceae bacterium]|nr:TetR/AcrR family transcriptional regulator [Kofleriaceae bacterium]